MTLSICHLVETQSDLLKRPERHLVNSAEFEVANHEIRSVGGRTFRAQSFDVDVIVSHIPIRWKTFPFLVSLRAANPNSKIIHVDLAANKSNKPLRQTAFALFDQVIMAN